MNFDFNALVYTCIYGGLAILFTTYLFNNKQIDDNISHEQQLSDPNPVNVITPNWKKIAKDIIIEAHEYHAANNILLSSTWISPFNSNIVLELKLYSSSTYEFKLIKKGNENKIILHIDSNKILIDNVKPSDVNTVLTYINSIHDIIKNKNIIHEPLDLPDHALVSFKSRAYALANYPNYKNDFKTISIADDALQGQFLLNGSFSLENLVAIFPDADRISIFQPSIGIYKVYDTTDISKIFIF